VENENEVFGGSQAENPSPPTRGKTNGGLIAVAQQREVAEVQAAMMIARKFPRDEKEALDKILQACTRPKLAESALYQYSRGGADITGPSIRLAEVMAQNWGNFECGVRELEQRDEESVVETYAWDIQTNFRDKKVFSVPHIRRTKKGAYKLSDPRDIYEMVANQGARRKRANILAVIPGDIQEAAIKQCEVTLHTRAEVTPERLKNLLEKFAEFGVTKEQIEARIQRRLDAMTPALLVQMGKIYNSLKDGMSTAAEWFSAKAETGKGSLDISDLKTGKEENRGHGQENLDKVGKPEAPKTPQAAPQEKARQTPAPKADQPKAASTPVGSTDYGDVSNQPDPFASGELSFERQPGEDDK